MMQKTMTLGAVALTGALTLMATFGPALAQSAPEGGKPPGPPQEAIAACSGKQAGDVCQFDGRNGTVSGSCMTPPEDSSAPAACAPEGGPDGAPPPRN